MFGHRRYFLWLRPALLPLGLVAALAGCGGDNTSGPGATLNSNRAKALASTTASTTASQAVKIVALTKVGEIRISRTIYDYVFKITIQNDSVARSAIMATATGSGQGTTILDGSVLVGDLAVGATVIPSDTITLRTDRALPFSASAIVWQITEPINGNAVPPQPDPLLNAATIAGIDTNSNGVRDDIDRLIASKFGTNQQDFAVAVANAKTLQKALVSPSTSASDAHINAFRCIEDSQKLSDLGSMDNAMLDTPIRRKAYGSVFAGSYISTEGC